MRVTCDHLPTTDTYLTYHLSTCLQAGVDAGSAHAELNLPTGRLTYRGPVLNRASRISGLAGLGEVGVGGLGWAWGPGVLST